MLTSFILYVAVQTSLEPDFTIDRVNYKEFNHSGRILC